MVMEDAANFLAQEVTRKEGTERPRTTGAPADEEQIEEVTNVEESAKANSDEDDAMESPPRGDIPKREARGERRATKANYKDASSGEDEWFNLSVIRKN